MIEAAGDVSLSLAQRHRIELQLQGLRRLQRCGPDKSTGTAIDHHKARKHLQLIARSATDLADLLRASNEAEGPLQRARGSRKFALEPTHGSKPVHDACLLAIGSELQYPRSPDAYSDEFFTIGSLSLGAANFLSDLEMRLTGLAIGAEQAQQDFPLLPTGPDRDEAFYAILLAIIIEFHIAGGKIDVFYHATRKLRSDGADDVNGWEHECVRFLLKLQENYPDIRFGPSIRGIAAAAEKARELGIAREWLPPKKGGGKRREVAQLSEPAPSSAPLKTPSSTTPRARGRRSKC
ncbi:MAG: hypothetical protein AB7F78_23690 [Hyphomicrobiaceae bacterium]